MAEYVDYTYVPDSGGGNFLNLKAKGDKVTIRFLEKPIAYFVHWIDNKPSICADKEVCVICQELEKLPPEELKKKEVAQRRRRQTFIWPVVDRKDGMVKIFKSGVNIFLGVGVFANDPNWGGPEKEATKFDVTITRTEASLQNFYSVVPDPTSLGVSITADEKKEAAKLGALIDAISTGASAEDIADESTPAVESQSVEEAESAPVGEGFVEKVKEEDSKKEKKEDDLPF